MYRMLLCVILGAALSNAIWLSDLVPAKTVIEEKIVTNVVTVTNTNTVLADEVTAGMKMNTCRYFEVYDGEDHVVQICKKEIIRR